MKKDRAGLSQRLHLLFNLLMILIYAAAGIILIFVWGPEGLPEENRKIAGLVLILYSLFRIWKLAKAQRPRDDKQNVV